MTDGTFLGARFSSDHTAVLFRVFAPRAERIELWLYAAPLHAPAFAIVAMAPSAFGVFSVTVTVDALRTGGLIDFIYYGYRAWGPNWSYDPAWAPGSDAGFRADVDRYGNRFNPNKLLLDPYALEVSHDPLTPATPDWTAYESGAETRRIDTGGIAPKGIVLDVPVPAYGTKPERPFKDEIIYEVHLRGLTKNDASVPESQRGTYAGAMARVEYLKALGVTAVEFQPIHTMQSALNDVAGSTSHDYWGYDSVSYFAPSRRYAADASPGGPTREWMAMVKAFHDAGLKVYIDVVYNHHQEGDVDPATGTVGAIYSLRGLANSEYYEVLSDDAANQYQNDNGVGPNVNAAASAARNLVIASLTYYAHVLGVDGFRFDLAAVLGNANARGGYAFDRTDPDGILNRAVRELPARPAAGGPGVDLIAEPYTDHTAGQEQGNFPAGWSEWNDRYRDTVRASQNKLGVVAVTPGQLALRIAGSDDLFRANGRAPWNSVNYVVCHDGMTLADLHSFNRPHNDAPPPFGPSSGGRSASDEMCWDHGCVAADQAQAQRTSLALLALSAGVPMIGGGAEFGRAVGGNNNPFNLDTIANWLDWSLVGRHADLVRLTSRLLQFRKAHPALRPSYFFSGKDDAGTGAKDIAWYRDDGAEADGAYFEDGARHFLAYAIDGVAAGDTVDTIYVAYNAWSDSVDAVLPPLRTGTHWFRVADTGASGAAYGFIVDAGRETPFDAATVVVGARSLVLFIAR